MKTGIENLEEELSVKEKKIQQQMVDYRRELWLKDQELTSKKLLNEDLTDQINFLKEKISSYNNSGSDSDLKVLKSKSEIKNSNKLEDETKLQFQRNKSPSHTKEEELTLDGNEVRQSIIKKNGGTVDCEGCDEDFHQVNEVGLSMLTAQQILDKFSISEKILSGIESELHAVLHKWKNRKRKIKKRIISPNPNTGITFLVRSVVAFFNIAMEQIKIYEEGENEKEIMNSRMRKNNQKISDLLKYIIKLEEVILELRRKNSEIKEENEKHQNSEYNGRLPPVPTTPNQGMLRYLDDYSGAALRGDIPDDDQIPHTHSYHEEKGQEVTVVREESADSYKSPAALQTKQDKEIHSDYHEHKRVWMPVKVVDVKCDVEGHRLLIQYEDCDENYDELNHRFNPSIDIYQSSFV